MNCCLPACLVGLTLASWVSAQDTAPRNARFPKWISDYPAARKIARDSGRAMFVVLRCEP